MYRILRSPRWWAGHLLVVVICAVFVNLGMWQLRRLQERQIENTVIASRMAADPIAIEDLVAGAGSDIDSLEFRGAAATGVFDPQQEVLLRSQVHEGTAGWHVITPLVLGDGKAVLVNRGWVPLEMDTVPVPAVPPEGEIVMTGWVGLTRVRSATGRVEPEGQLSQISRVDLDRLQEQMPYPILDVYLVADPNGAELPIAPSRPDPGDEGPHLLYAIEWFSFALIGAVGYGFLLKRAVHRTHPTPESDSAPNSGAVGGDPQLGEAVHDGDIGEQSQ